MAEAARFIPVTVVDKLRDGSCSVWHPHWTELPADGEGTRWIHGHYDYTSPEAKALLVAHALTEPNYGAIVFDQATPTESLRGKRFPLDANGNPQGLASMHMSDIYYVERPRAP